MTKKQPEMIGRRITGITPGGFITRETTRHKEPTLYQVSKMVHRAATRIIDSVSQYRNPTITNRHDT